MKADMEGVNNKIEAEKAAIQEWASLSKEEEGEEAVLLRKLDANQEANQEMEMTERRLRDILAEINAQTDAMTATVEDLEADKGRVEAEVQAVRNKVQSELDEVDFRLGVQAKAIAGLEGFKRKLQVCVTSSYIVSHHHFCRVETPVRVLVANSQKSVP